MLAAVGYIFHIMDLQRVQIRAKRNPWRSCIADIGDNAAIVCWNLAITSNFSETIDQIRGGLKFLPADFRIAVQVTAQLDKGLTTAFNGLIQMFLPHRIHPTDSYRTPSKKSDAQL